MQNAIAIRPSTSISLSAKLLGLALLAVPLLIPIAHACGFLAGLIF